MPKSCDQDIVNVAVGSWIGATLLLDLLIVSIYPRRKHQKEDDTHDFMLLEDCYSPVGFRVAILPSFTIDPNNAKKGLPVVSVEHEMYSAVFLAIVIMGMMLSLAFTDWTKTVESHIVKMVGQFL